MEYGALRAEHIPDREHFNFFESNLKEKKERKKEKRREEKRKEKKKKR